nr:MAG: hypothetical protein DIU78_02325 [Pseudomonadota bacterium]
MSGKALASLDGLSSLTSVDVISVSGPSFTDITGLSSLVDVGKLSIGATRLRTLSGLENATNSHHVLGRAQPVTAHL